LPQYHIVKCQIRDNVENETKMNHRNKDGRIFTVLFLVGDVVLVVDCSGPIVGVVVVSLFIILCPWRCKCSTNLTSYTDDAQHTATENRRKCLILCRYG